MNLKETPAQVAHRAKEAIDKEATVAHALALLLERDEVVEQQKKHLERTTEAISRIDAELSDLKWGEELPWEITTQQKGKGLAEIHRATLKEVLGAGD